MLGYVCNTLVHTFMPFITRCTGIVNSSIYSPLPCYALEFRQNGLSRPIHGVINISIIGLLFQNHSIQRHTSITAPESQQRSVTELQGECVWHPLVRASLNDLQKVASMTSNSSPASQKAMVIQLHAHVVIIIMYIQGLDRMYLFWFPTPFLSRSTDISLSSHYIYIISFRRLSDFILHFILKSLR
jgi:hypothetical protein